MNSITIENSESRTDDIQTDNIEILKQLFPDACTEGKIDFEILKQLLSCVLEEREEKYGLNWNGKRRARQLSLTPSMGTLRPGPQEGIDWDATQNLMIEGDNLEVLKLLKKSYTDKVKLIYIDPPYNTGKDFIYPDNFHDNVKNYLELTGQLDGNCKISSNTEANGRFHTEWLNMMYPRLALARDLLSNDGLIFVSIGQEELSNLKIMMDQIFGEENYRNIIAIKRGAKSVQAQFDTWDKLGTAMEYILFYSKQATFRFPKMMRNLGEVKQGSWNNHWRGTDRPTMRYELFGIKPETGQWRWSKERSFAAIANYNKMIEEAGKSSNDITQEDIDKWYLNKNEEIDLLRLSTNQKPEHYIPPTDETLLNDVWFHLFSNDSYSVKTLLGEKYFDNPKPVDLIAQVVQFAPTDSIILDFFAGSGTTGHAVMAQNAIDGGNRRYMLVQLPEPLDIENKDQKNAALYCDQLGKPRNIAELTKERLRCAANKIKKENPNFSGDLGFRVFKLDSSNIRTWDPDRQNLEKELLDNIEHIKNDRTDQDILYELLLKFGLDLCIPIETLIIAGKVVHSIGAGTLFACLDTNIALHDVEPLALGIADWHKKLAPATESTVIFLDRAFENDLAKTNLTAILEQHGFESKNIKSL